MALRRKKSVFREKGRESSLRSQQQPKKSRTPCLFIEDMVNSGNYRTYLPRISEIDNSQKLAPIKGIIYNKSVSSLWKEEILASNHQANEGYGLKQLIVSKQGFSLDSLADYLLWIIAAALLLAALGFLIAKVV